MNHGFEENGEDIGGITLISLTMSELRKERPDLQRRKKAINVDTEPAEESDQDGFLVNSAVAEAGCLSK